MMTYQEFLNLMAEQDELNSDMVVKHAEHQEIGYYAQADIYTIEGKFILAVVKSDQELNCEFGNDFIKDLENLKTTRAKTL